MIFCRHHITRRLYVESFVEMLIYYTSFFSWRRYCNKHQIRLGAYTMEDRGEDGDMDVDGDIQEDNPHVDGSSNPGTSKTTRNGSPVPPKILYKSTTGKGVAFTPDDVQYMMDYMKYRK